MKALSEKIVELIENARVYVSKTANTTMVYTYFHIGKLIVEEMQKGEERAEYGANLLIQVSIDLKKNKDHAFVLFLILNE
jgi:hypothetical protein